MALVPQTLICSHRVMIVVEVQSPSKSEQQQAKQDMILLSTTSHKVTYAIRDCVNILLGVSNLRIEG